MAIPPRAALSNRSSRPRTQQWDWKTAITSAIPGTPGGSATLPGGGYWAVKYIIIANIAVFVIQMMIAESTNWLDLRQAEKISTATGFYEQKLVDGRPPTRIRLRTDAKPDAELEPGTPVTQLGARYGEHTLVIWDGRSGVVRQDALTVDPLRSWQLAWRLLTSGFCHDTGNLMHILFNMLVLFFFGRMIEPLYGSKEFLLFFLCGIVISGIGHVAWQVVVGQNIPAVGASGGVMAVVFLAAMIYPRQRVLLMFVIPVELRILAVIYAFVDVIGALNPGSGTAHWAHLGGAAFGVAYKYFGWNISGLWQSVRRRFQFSNFKPSPKIRVYRPEEPEDEIDSRVDMLLEKISKHGESSLTDAERDFLAEASRRYRKPLSRFYRQIHRVVRGFADPPSSQTRLDDEHPGRRGKWRLRRTKFPTVGKFPSFSANVSARSPVGSALLKRTGICC